MRIRMAIVASAIKNVRMPVMITADVMVWPDPKASPITKADAAPLAGIESKKENRAA